jgi:hypothetical protein
LGGSNCLTFLRSTCYLLTSTDNLTLNLLLLQRCQKTAEKSIRSLRFRPEAKKLDKRFMSEVVFSKTSFKVKAVCRAARKSQGRNFISFKSYVLDFCWYLSFNFLF